MKKIKFEYLILAILFAIVLLFAFYGCDSTNQDYVSPPEPVCYWDKQVKFSGQKKVGETIKFWVSMPPGFNSTFRWFFDYGNNTNAVTGSDTIYYKYKKPGTYYVNVTGWNSDMTSMDIGNAAKLQIKAQ